MALTEALKWRYATKKMNGQSVAQDKVDKITEAACLAPTANGLQPFRIIQVSNNELKEKIKPIANNQTQITDCSHLLVFAAWDTYTSERIEAVIKHTTKERGLPEGTLANYQKILSDMFLSKTELENFVHTSRQAYIGLGVAIAAAAELRVDATPMEGFDNNALDELLDLKAKGLRSVALLPLGYRDEQNDWLVNMKKVRTPKKEFLIELN